MQNTLENLHSVVLVVANDFGAMKKAYGIMGMGLKHLRKIWHNQDFLNFRETRGIKNIFEESVKLGHFEPEVLNVDIDDIRKGIVPEFDPPPEMIGGYQQNQD